MFDNLTASFINCLTIVEAKPPRASCLRSCSLLYTVPPLFLKILSSSSFKTTPATSLYVWSLPRILTSSGSGCTLGTLYTRPPLANEPLYPVVGSLGVEPLAADLQSFLVLAGKAP